MSDKYTFGWSDPRGVFGMTSPKTEREKVVEAAAVQMELFDLFDDAIKLEYVGSRVTCVPAPTDTDEDVLILVKNVDQFAGKCIAVDASIYIYRFQGEDRLIEHTYLLLSLLLKHNITPIFVFDGKAPIEKQQIIKTTPLGRVCQTKDVANAVEACINLLTFTTGSTIILDGGRLI